MNAVSDVETLEGNNFLLSEEVNKLNQKIVVLENQLESVRNSSYQPTNSNKNDS